eukprot:2358637-Rhodomonas_salina.1
MPPPTITCPHVTHKSVFVTRHHRLSTHVNHPRTCQQSASASSHSRRRSLQSPNVHEHAPLFRFTLSLSLALSIVFLVPQSVTPLDLFNPARTLCRPSHVPVPQSRLISS